MWQGFSTSYAAYQEYVHACLNYATMQKGLRPHNYCLPILKREKHREAIASAATSGNKKFFLGTDSAPHATHTKEAPCGCAGIFSAPIALPLYAMAFEKVSVVLWGNDACKIDVIVTTCTQRACLDPISVQYMSQYLAVKRSTLSC